MTKCYALIRGSAIRVTEIDKRGRVGSPVRYATTPSVATVTINEVSDSGNNELLRNDSNEGRVRFVDSARSIRFLADLQLLKCDPAILSLMTKVPLVTDYAGNIVGFDSDTRLTTSSFALEVWSQLAGNPCDSGGARQWGYTLFPFMRGGVMSGFTFSNGLVSFKITKAMSQRRSPWRVGPYDLNAPWQRLDVPVSRNTSWRTTLVTAQPPVRSDGIVSFDDVIHGGTAASTTSDVIQGGTAASTSSWIIDGGRA